MLNHKKGLFATLVILCLTACDETINESDNKDLQANQVMTGIKGNLYENLHKVISRDDLI